MADGPDENDDAQVIDDNEDREPGTEGEGAEGSNAAGRDEDGGVSAELSGSGDDEGSSSARETAQPDAQQRGSRFQRLANENREYKERLGRLEREREEERQRWQRQQQAAAEQQERDRIALMTPEERSEYRFTAYQQHMDQRLRDMQLQNAMQVDKAAYDAKAANNPVYRRMASEVEDVFQEQVRKGQPTDRETILYHLLGKQAVNGASNSRPRQQARRRVESQRVAPSSGKGDTARRGERQPSTAAERLKDVLI